MNDFIYGLSEQELRQIKISISNLMLTLNKDLKSSIKNNHYDEIQMNIQCLDDYSRLLNKIVRNILYRKEK